MTQTFVEAWVEDRNINPIDIDDWVDRWHKSEGEDNGSLQEFLGFTEAEYKKWATNPDYLEEILNHRMRMHTRPPFEDVYMALALKMAERSTCSRLAVGCAITSTDYRKVFAVGYNGNASGLDNNCDSTEPGKCGCLHAEENAVINCDTHRDREKVVFCSHLPCSMCAKRLINLGGVKSVFYENDYRIRDSVDLFRAVGIRCLSMDDLRRIAR